MSTVPVGRTASLGAEARAALELARRFRRVYPRGGFEGWEPAELQVLVSLWLNDSVIVSRLSGSLELAQPTVSHALARLGNADLVAADPDPGDGRSRCYRLTPDGRSLVDRFLEQASPHLRPD